MGRIENQSSKTNILLFILKGILVKKWLKWFLETSDTSKLIIPIRPIILEIIIMILSGIKVSIKLISPLNLLASENVNITKKTIEQIISINVLVIIFFLIAILSVSGLLFL